MKVLRLPTLELFELDLKREGEGRLWNWRLLAINGEPLAHGTGEKYGAFSSPRSAWLSALRTMRAFHSAIAGVEENVPSPRKGVPLIFGDENGPKIRVLRKESLPQ